MRSIFLRPSKIPPASADSTAQKDILLVQNDIFYYHWKDVFTQQIFIILAFDFTAIFVIL